MKESPKVGGQAVLEGVMMRSPGCLAVAVRRASGQIVIREDVWRSIWDRLKFLRWPVLRGSVIMIEAMINGMQALNFSAREAMSEEEKNEGEGAEESGWGIALTIVLGLAIAIGLFKVLPHLAATFAGNILFDRSLTVDDVWYHVVDGVVKVGIFIGYVAVIGLSKDIRRVFMYHGAEHMAIYTLEAGEDLTVENAREKTTLHPRCGTAFIMVVILVFIVVAAVALPFIPEWAKPSPEGGWYRHLFVVMFKLPLLIPVAGVAYEFNRFAGKHVDSPFLRPLLWPGLGMQLLTTKKPTDDQLEIALVALRIALWRESVGSDKPAEEETQVFKDFNSFVETFPVPGTSDAVT
ncbi:MAG: DUF1385 domain-containing protein [Deltaproteobacteria bacterium]|nr:DUF1385 domain-containing protein [Deltaproteobacteria bacterium]